MVINIVKTCLLIYTTMFFNIRWCSCNESSPNNSTLRCIPSERAALLSFKHNLTYFDKDVSSSWKGEECCEWSRVRCDDTTGNVLELNLYGNDTNNNLLKMEKLDSLVYLLELTQLERLDLRLNSFSYSTIPKLMGLMKQLRYLLLSSASLGGLVPNELGNLTNLEYLELNNNQLSGKIPTSIGNLSKLQVLDISSNPLGGTVLSKPHFTNLSSLIELYIDDTTLTLNLSFNWVPPFQLENFWADNCKIDGQLLPWLQTQKSLFGLSLSNANISGPLLDGLSHIMPNLNSLSLSNNQITGHIPDSLCQLTSLDSLDINNNSLSGEIPNCFANFSSLSYVRLSYNKLKGHIPCFNNSESHPFGQFIDFVLHLNDNMLSGEIPSCLSDLTNLTVLHIGGNQLSGNMLNWFSVAEKFRELQILRIRGNKFSGPIPRMICSLPNLQIMDLAHNQLTGYIPRCLSNLTAMTSPNASQMTTIDDINEVFQGIEHEYTSTLPYLVDIDLSFNKLVGSIPNDLTKISGLLSLNLSYNQLSGTIPVNIGGLKSLVSLDLSNNKLRGSIPTSIGELYMLSHLDLSYNNLSGSIPTGNQLQTLSDQASIYAGNPYLCGDFLPKKCKSEADEQGKNKSNKGKGDITEKLEKMGFGLVVMSGFATGFWGVVGGMVLSRRWRHEVFRRVENGYNWLYILVVVRMAKARRFIRR